MAKVLEDLREHKRQIKLKSYWKNRDKYLLQQREKRLQCRETALQILGGKCVICGEGNRRYLHLDRINGGMHIRKMYWILKHIEEFQVLCANHHNEKTVYKEIIWP